MAPKLYGIEHIIYLSIFILIVITTCILTKKFIKTDNQKKVLIKSVAGLLLVFIIMNRISIVFKFNSWWKLIPDTYCGMTSLLLSLSLLILNKNSKVFHFLWYVGLIGGFATMVYPDFLSQNVSFFYLPTISGLIHHSILFLACVLIVEIGWIKFEMKNLKYYPLGICFYTLMGLFMIDVFKFSHAMCVKASIIDGTPLYWWFLLIVGTILVFIYLFILEKIRTLRKTK